MTYPIRPIEPAEFTEFRKVMTHGQGFHPRPEDAEFMRTHFYELDRALAVYDREQMVGTAGAVSLEMSVPGGASLPIAGVTMVAVLPTHRRRGILTQLMRRQLSDIREKGEAIAGLYASESIIYRRFGYGIATFHERWAIDRRRAAFNDPIHEGGRVRSIDADDAPRLFPPVLERLLSRRPGMMRRTAKTWAIRLRDPEHSRSGASAYFYAVHETDGNADGYVIYRIRRDWREGFSNAAVTDVELIGVNSEVEASLWNLCFNIDLTESIEADNRPVDDPLLWRLGDPRRLRRMPYDGLWVRIVDVSKALSTRRYPVRGRLVLDIRDDFEGCAQGKFLLEGGPEGGSCVATNAEPDIAMDVSSLGSLYLGGGNAYAIAGADHIAELKPNALQRMAMMFGWPLAPWCIEYF